MLTRKQLIWLNHLSDTNQVKIVDYNPGTKQAFDKLKASLKNILGDNAQILHRGATSLGICGKGEIDLYILSTQASFKSVFEKIKSQYGEPGSFYPNERVRWNINFKGFAVEIFLVNKQHPSWVKSYLIEEYMIAHPKILEKYRILKENADGVSTREYYRRKLEFYNEIAKLLKT